MNFHKAKICSFLIFTALIGTICGSGRCRSFGADVDYGQIVKVYTHDAAHHPERHYSAPSFASAMRRPITGSPEMDLVSTSYIERLNATTRLHMRRLTRLTLAFSKKLENFEAAVALHFAYYNFVKRHNTLRCLRRWLLGLNRVNGRSET